MKHSLSRGVSAEKGRSSKLPPGFWESQQSSWVPESDPKQQEVFLKLNCKKQQQHLNKY